MVLFAFVRQFTRNVWIAAALLTATDLLIDPLGSGALGFWRWSTPGLYFGVPLSNFVGWFLVSLLMFAMDRRPMERNVSQRVLGVSVLLFFAARV
jgi:putative membrane protein